LAGDPTPLAPEDRHTLSWEAAVERLFDAAEARELNNCLALFGICLVFSRFWLELFACGGQRYMSPEVRVLSGPFERPSEASFSRLAYDLHFGVMKDDTVLGDIVRRTTFGEEEYTRYWGELSDRLLAPLCCAHPEIAVLFCAFTVYLSAAFACHLFLQPLCAFRSQHKEASRMKQCADSAIAMFCSCRWHFRPSSSHIVLYRPQQPRLNFTVQQGFCRGGTSHIHAVTITLFTCFTSSFGMEQTWVDEEKTLSLEGRCRNRLCEACAVSIPSNPSTHIQSAMRWPSILAQLQWEFQADLGAMRILGELAWLDTCFPTLMHHGCLFDVHNVFLQENTTKDNRRWQLWEHCASDVCFGSENRRA